MEVGVDTGAGALVGVAGVPTGRDGAQAAMSAIEAPSMTLNNRDFFMISPFLKSGFNPKTAIQFVGRPYDGLLVNNATRLYPKAHILSLDTYVINYLCSVVQQPR